jgi:hypothetical protein
MLRTAFLIGAAVLALGTACPARAQTVYRCVPDEQRVTAPDRLVSAGRPIPARLRSPWILRCRFCLLSNQGFSESPFRTSLRRGSPICSCTRAFVFAFSVNLRTKKGMANPIITQIPALVSPI